MDWIAERVETLTELWNQGVPASEIGRRLGVTKNAVVGKAHRLGLPRRESPIGRGTRKSGIVRLEKLSAGMCSWPEGHPGTPGFRFCGKPAVRGKPYCLAHCARAYVRGSKEEGKTAAASAGMGTRGRGDSRAVIQGR